jgi:hypothetical protein
MIFTGKFTSRGNIDASKLTVPIFPSRKRVIAIDVEEVLVLQKGSYVSGRRAGSDRYVKHHQANELIHRALKGYDFVTLWSTSPPDNGHAMDLLKDGEFSDVHQRIYGCSYRNGCAIKDLRLLVGKENIDFVVGLEDSQRYFIPRRQVIHVHRHGNLLEAFEETFELSSKTYTKYYKTRA